MDQKQRREYLLRYLLDERADSRDTDIPNDEMQQRRLLRGLMNVRMPGKVAPEFLRIQDEYLRDELARKKVQDVNELRFSSDGLALWQGDITLLRADAIVNAANSRMLGCFIPNHSCIDNAIQTYAGIQMRYDCDRLMRAQGYEEPTGRAKITRGYNLPAKYVLHTVGPIINGALTQADEELLAGCYRSCLQLAGETGLENVAFCCISTGVFHFPKRRAAEIAVDTVREELQKKTGVRRVIFNVFGDDDWRIYEDILGL